MDGRAVAEALAEPLLLACKLELAFVALEEGRKEVEAMAELAPRVPSEEGAGEGAANAWRAFCSAL
jgi:hypothetical protein